MKLTYLGDYIQGRFTKCKAPNGVISSLNPGDLNDAKVAVPFSFDSIQEATTAARSSFRTWRRMKAPLRLEFAGRYAKALRLRAQEIAETISTETGRPLWETTLEVEQTANLIDYFITQGSQTQLQLKQATATTETVGMVRFFSRGVFAVISPSVQPLLVPHSHFIPALINGNTVILKSSSRAPFTAQLVAEIMHQSGFPSGVFNLLHGQADSARRLVTHADVNGVFYTGNHETGQKLHKQLSDDFRKTLVLEIGGKNTTIIWEDANYSKALHETLFSAYVSSGQRCTSTGRVFVHDKIFDRFLSDFHNLSKKCRVGYAFESSFMGPLVSEAAVENYLRYQGMAVREGCEEVMRGKVLDRDRKGYYVSPSIHLALSFDTKSIYQQNEVYGPDVAFYRVKDVEEVISINLGSTPTLVTSVYSSAHDIYQVFIDDLKSGVLNWNLPTTEVSYQLPYGSPAGNFRPMGSLAGYQCAWPISSLESHGDYEIPLPQELSSIW